MVYNFKVKTIIILVLIIFQSCQLKKEIHLDDSNSESNIQGLWFCILNDSSYAEVYFSDSSYLFYHSDFFRIYDYKIAGDSIQVIDDIDKSVYGINFSNNKSFSIKSENDLIYYYKIEDVEFTKDEFQSLINEDSEVHEIYRASFRIRRDQVQARKLEK